MKSKHQSNNILLLPVHTNSEGKKKKKETMFIYILQEAPLLLDQQHLAKGTVFIYTSHRH